MRAGRTVTHYVRNTRYRVSLTLPPPPSTNVFLVRHRHAPQQTTRIHLGRGQNISKTRRGHTEIRAVTRRLNVRRVRLQCRHAIR